MQSTSTRPLLIATALAALTTAALLLALQIVGGLEYTEGGSLYVRASMIAAMVVLAVLPIFIEVARRTGHSAIGLALFVAFAGFLAYSLPANIGRNGEVKEAKVIKSEDAAQARAEVASVNRSLNWFRTEMMRECEGAPAPLPPQGWPKCRSNRANVKALEERRDRLETQIAKAPVAGDVGSETISWATAGYVSEKNIRRASIMAFAIGLDIAIWALVWLATSLLTTLPNRLQPTATDRNQPETVATDNVVYLPEPPTGGTNRKDAALADLLTLMALGHDVPSQEWLRERWGMEHKGTVSRWMKEWEDRDLITRTKAARCKAVSA